MSFLDLWHALSVVGPSVCRCTKTLVAFMGNVLAYHEQTLESESISLGSNMFGK